MHPVHQIARSSPEPDAPADVPPTTETVHGWPGTRLDQPAGLYSWPVAPGVRWMHKVPESWTRAAPDSVELTFYAAAPADRPTMESLIYNGWWDDGTFDQPAPAGHPVRTEMWLLDVGGTRIAMLLDSHPDTDPALLAEARAVIESIVVEPTGPGHRLVFRLLAGWDSG